MKRFFSIFQQPNQTPPSHTSPISPISSPTSSSSQISNVHPSLRQKLHRNGQKYHMRIVVKGDAESGKTQLFHRLKGEPYHPQYTHSTTIKSAYIHWNYKNSDDTIVLELWDVTDADSQRRKKKQSGLKLSHVEESDNDDSLSDSSQDQDSPTTTTNDTELDSALEMQMRQFIQNGMKVEEGSHIFAESLNSSLIDVYKNAHCVIVLVNILRRKSWGYARKQISKVPKGLDVVVMPNYMDREAERTVTREEIAEWCAQKSAQHGSTIHIIEASMKNCFGLKHLYTYFNIPFCKLKVDTVQKELKRLKEELKENRTQVGTTLQAADYKQYLKWLQEGNAPERAVPFSEEIVAARVKAGQGARGGNAPAKAAPPAKGQTNATQKPRAAPASAPTPAGTEGIPEHILRKYNLAGPSTDVPLPTAGGGEIKSVNDFRIEGDIDNFWGDDSGDSDADSHTESTFADTAITSQRSMTQVDDSSSDEDGFERPVLTPDEDIVDKRSSRKKKSSSSRSRDKKKKRSSKRQRRKPDTPPVSEENKTDRTEDDGSDEDNARSGELDQIKDHSRKASMASSIGQLHEAKSPLTPLSNASLAGASSSDEDNISSDDEVALKKKSQRDEERKKQQKADAEACKVQEEKERQLREAERVRLEEERKQQEELRKQQEEERKQQEALRLQQEKERQAQESLKEFSIASNDSGAFFGGDSSDEDEEQEEKQTVDMPMADSEAPAPEDSFGASDDDDEEMGYIDRPEVKEESSDDDSSEDDSKSRRRKRGAAKKQPAKSKPTAAPSTSTTKTLPTDLPPEVLKAIQEAEAQLKQNVETQEKKKHRSSRRHKKDEDKEGGEKKKKHRSSRRHKKDEDKDESEVGAAPEESKKKRRPHRSGRKEKSSRHRREKSSSSDEDED